MNRYHRLTATLSNSQLDRLKSATKNFDKSNSATKNSKKLTLKISQNMVNNANNKHNFSH